MDASKKDRSIDLEQKSREQSQRAIMHRICGLTAFIGLGLGALRICSDKGIPSEETPLWLFVAFWGIYALANLTVFTFVISNILKFDALQRQMEEVERERMRKGLEYRRHWLRPQVKSSGPSNAVFAACRQILGLGFSMHQSTTDGEKLLEDDKLAQLQHRIQDWQGPSKNWMYAGQLLCGIAIVSSIIRWYNGRGHDEMGLLFNICFFGGYAFGIVIWVCFLVGVFVNTRSRDKLVREFDRERARRGLDLRVVGEKGVGHDAGSC